MPELNEILRKRIVCEVASEKVVVQKDLTYKQMDDAALKFDVYRPEGRGGTLPAVIFVHGDAQPELLKHAKEWGQYVSWGELIASQDMVAITFNHRSMARGARLEDAIEDVMDMLAYLRQHVSELGVDPDKLSLWVCSAGGPPGLYAALTAGARYLNSIVAFYPFMDLQCAREGILSLVSDESIRRYSPTVHIQPGLPPIFIARAGLDWPELNRSIERFVTAAFAAGLEVELHNHAQGRHAFDILDDFERSRQIIRRAVEFIREHLPGE